MALSAEGLRWNGTRDGAPFADSSGTREDGELARFSALLDESGDHHARRRLSGWYGGRRGRRAGSHPPRVARLACSARARVRPRLVDQYYHQRLPRLAARALWRVSPSDGAASGDGWRATRAGFVRVTGASDHAAALDLRAAINTLDEDLRLIVTLRYYTGMDSTAIGAGARRAGGHRAHAAAAGLGLLRERLSGAGYPARRPRHYSDTDIPDSTEGRRSDG